MTQPPNLLLKKTYLKRNESPFDFFRYAEEFRKERQ